jgi:hypothetical protein
LAGIQRDHLREYGKNVTAWMSFPGGTLWSCAFPVKSLLALSDFCGFGSKRHISGTEKEDAIIGYRHSVSLSRLQVSEADHTVQMYATKYGSLLCFCSYRCTIKMESAEHQVSKLLVECIVLHNWRKTNIKYCIGYRNNIFICELLKTCNEYQHSHRRWYRF